LVGYLKTLHLKKTAHCAMLQWAMDLTRKPYNVEIKYGVVQAMWHAIVYEKFIQN
jgi:hypothetical protein